MDAHKNPATLPENFDTLEDFWQFWDNHSTADYEDMMVPVEVTVEISSNRIYFPVAKDIFQKIRTQAQQQGVSTETLVNLWLQEKLYSVA